MRGQKKPRSPSLRLRGTTWTWRCGTLWLTRLFIATKLPAAPSTVSIAADSRCARENSGSSWSAGQVGQRLVVLPRHEQRVAGEQRPHVEERHAHVVVEDDVRGQLARR